MLRNLGHIALFSLAAAVCNADEVKGRIASIDQAAAAVEISGVVVDASGARIETLAHIPCRLADLKVGNLVEAEGVFIAPGRFKARSIERELGRSGEIEGTVRWTDSVTGSLSVDGITVTIAEGGAIRDRWYRRTDLRTMAPGTPVNCEGKWTGPLQFSAREVRVRWKFRKSEDSTPPSI